MRFRFIIMFSELSPKGVYRILNEEKTVREDLSEGTYENLGYHFSPSMSSADLAWSFSPKIQVSSSHDTGMNLHPVITTVARRDRNHDKLREHGVSKG